MPTTSEVRDALTAILAQVTGVAPDAVEDSAALTSLGVDSLARVEVVDELGRRFGRRIPDDRATDLRTVRDVVRALEAAPEVATAPVGGGLLEAGPSATGALATRMHTPSADDRFRPREHSDLLTRLALWFVVVGVVVGIGAGMVGSAAIRATGMTDLTLPPLAKPTTASSPTPTSTNTARPQVTPTNTTDPTLFAESDRVAPGQRFSLSGRFPEASSGQELQVQVRDPEGDWEDFPVTTEVEGDGRFSTKLWTSRTGVRKFRVLDVKSGLSTPSVTVQIG